MEAIWERRSRKEKFELNSRGKVREEKKIGRIK